MGNVRFYQGNVDVAIALHKQALELQPDYPAAKHDLELVQSFRRERNPSSRK